ncbi:MAG: bis(5'-nucleosyl)-tetraphosphatase (symmetrical) YqeK [Treponema sp.]|nr:bis(5'-nucleosyl)-tetraphosphatase (symmetrical) YqeK [Treponema sp.]MCI7566159.1 bis(5'-nucleosyl)-tetraphosphatase (symmetrical) YqeK [Treponema sp.]
MKDIIELTEEIRIFAQEHVKKSRYEHSIRVAETCARLCRMFALDDDVGYLAGVGHDMCKDFSDQELFDLAAKDGNPIIPYEKRNPALLHGRAAAVLMKEKFGIEDKDILEAVAYHTSGVMGMCDLSKCLFIADKIEPGRPQSTDEYRERLYKMNLDQMFYAVLYENYSYVLKKGYELFPTTEDLVKKYKVALPD